MPPVIDEQKCKMCGMCIDTCTEDVFFPAEGFDKEREKPRVSYPEACVHCNICVETCPFDAIRLRIPLAMHVPFK